MKKYLFIQLLTMALFSMSGQNSINIISSNLCNGATSGTAMISLTNPIPGATNYTFTVSGSTCAPTVSLTNSSGSTALVTLPCTGNFTITCFPFNSTVNPGNPVLITTGIFASYINAFTTPTISLTSQGGIVCAGSSFSMAMSGAMNYSINGLAQNSAIAVLSPSVPTCYTVTGTSASGCIGQAVQCVSVMPPPALVVSGNNFVCPGQSLTLNAAGAANYLWTSANQNFTTATIVLTPTASGCVQLAGANSAGCTSTTQACYSVAVLPPASIAASSGTVCKGTSSTLTFSGVASTYTWNTGSTASTINVMPMISTVYSVNVTYSNNCTRTATFALGVDTTCADVWPGDANSDGVVSTLDVLELGLQASSTGIARSPGGNTYVAQQSGIWSGLISTGKNKCHADCNGDGVVNQNDTLAIYNNFSLTHAFKPAGAASGDLDLVSAGNVFNAGSWNVVDVVLGSSASPQNQIYGLAFELNFDNSVVVPDSIYLVYTSSFVNNNNNCIPFRKNYFSNGKIYGALVRKDQNNVSGNGKIAEVHFKAKSQVNTGTQMNLGLSNVQRINKNAQVANLNGGTAVLNLESNPVGLSQNNKETAVAVYPNPARDSFTVRSSTMGQLNVIDLSGRTIFSANINGKVEVDSKNLQNGVYILEFKSAGSSSFSKLVIER